jgi:hypothetical protein
MSPYRVRLRHLPWRLRRRMSPTKEDLKGWDLPIGDDPLSSLLALFVMLLFAVGIVLPFVLGVVLWPFELALVAVLAGGDRLLKAARLRPWTVAVEELVVGRWIPVARSRVTGTAAARTERDRLTARLAQAGSGQARALLGTDVEFEPVPDPAAGGVQPVAGWYDDPAQPSRLRYWDGTAWTDHTWAKTTPSR